MPPVNANTKPHPHSGQLRTQSSPLWWQGWLRWLYSGARFQLHQGGANNCLSLLIAMPQCLRNLRAYNLCTGLTSYRMIPYIGRPFAGERLPIPFGRLRPYWQVQPREDQAVCKERWVRGAAQERLQLADERTSDGRTDCHLRRRRRSSMDVLSWWRRRQAG